MTTSKNTLGFLILLGFLFISIFWLITSYISAVNKEVDLFAMITEKQKSNQQIHDKMWKIIQQTGNIAEKEKEAFMSVVNSYMQVREGNTLDGRGSFMSMLKEAYPNNLPTLNYAKVMNVVESGRAEFQRSMTELFDVCREYTRLTERIPSRWFVTARPEKVELCKVVTSSRTTNAFASGVDDNIDINW